MRDLNAVGSNRVMQRTADVRRRSPSHSPSTPSPIGVIAPIPVITTRLASLMPLLLHRPPDARQGPRRDPMDEHRADDPRRRRAADEGPPRPGPVVYDRHVGPAARRLHPPDHVHARRYSPHVAIVHRRRGAVHPHLRDPPGGILERTERPPRRHLHQPAVAAPLQLSHPAVMRQQRRPALDVHRGVEHAVQRGAHPGPIDGPHQPPSGRQVATSRYPGRRSTMAATPAAASRRAAAGACSPGGARSCRPPP